MPIDNERWKWKVLLILIITLILNIYWGVFYILDQNWGRMSASFLMAFIIVLYCGLFSISWDVANLIQHLKYPITNRLSSEHSVVKMSSDNKEKTLGYYLVFLILTPSLIFLGAIESMKEKWFWMAIYFISCVIINEVTIFLIIRQKIKNLSLYILKIFSETTEDKETSN